MVYLYCAAVQVTRYIEYSTIAFLHSVLIQYCPVSVVNKYDPVPNSALQNDTLSNVIRIYRVSNHIEHKNYLVVSLIQAPKSLCAVPPVIS